MGVSQIIYIYRATAIMIPKPESDPYKSIAIDVSLFKLQNPLFSRSFHLNSLLVSVPIYKQNIGSLSTAHGFPFRAKPE